MKARADVMKGERVRLLDQEVHLTGEPEMTRSDFRPLSITPVGVTLSGFFAATYVLCLLAALVLPVQGMRMIFEAIVPGFVWLTAGSAILGLLWAIFIGWYIAIIFVPIRNYAFRRFA